MSIDKFDHDEWIFIELVAEGLPHIVLFALPFAVKLQLYHHLLLTFYNHYDSIDLIAQKTK